MIEILPDNAYHDLHVTVFPGFRNEGEDLVWQDWCVIGHYHPNAMTKEAIQNLVADFFAHYKDIEDGLKEKEDLHEYDMWRDYAEERFLAFASYYGYTAFRTCKINWLCD